MKFNTPFPQPLPKECAKAANIFQSFVDSANHGLDGIIPRNVIENARGFAIFTVFKAGFVLSARAGSGIVIARSDDGSWSAPSAIGTAGMGFGGQLGAEVTDFLVVLNSSAAVKSFMSAGSVTLGGNMSVAIGPLGRNGEATGALNASGKVAAMYSYSKTKGLFGGVSLEGSVIVERQDANAIAYDADVTAKQLLSGAVPVPPWASELINTLNRCTGMPGGRKWIDDSPMPGTPEATPGYAFAGISSPGGKKKRGPQPSPDVRKSDSYFDFPVSSPNPPEPPTDLLVDFASPGTSPFGPPPATTKQPVRMSSVSMSSAVDTAKPAPFLTVRAGLAAPLSPYEGVGRAIALHDFDAVEPGDLEFSKGDIIVIIKKSEKINDWWTGRVRGREGLFPANYVEVV